MTRVGVITGNGTGSELVDVFKTAVSRITNKLGKEVEVIDCEHEFRSYHGLLNREPAEIEAAVEEDLAKLLEFYKEFYSAGGRAIFRSAINAETLYRFRASGRALKTVHMPLAGKSILFVRDEMQGFYAIDACEIETDTIRFSSSFSLDGFRAVAHYSLAEAERVLRPEPEVWIVYKHHLFANVIEKWVQQVIPQATVCQPNHATQLLDDYVKTGGGRDLLLITGNEIGDIFHEVLIFQLGLGTRNTLYSRNTYTHPDFADLVEYQTVHGSADGIAGKQLVNPVATLRAAAAFIEEHLDEANYLSVMDGAIAAAEKGGVRAYDTGGRSSTREMTDAILKRLDC